MLPDRHGGDLADRTLTATLVVADWSSSCSACGGNADPNEDTHHTGSVPLVAGKGCGARFTAVAMHRDGRGLGPDYRPPFHPELPYVGRWPR